MYTSSPEYSSPRGLLQSGSTPLRRENAACFGQQSRAAMPAEMMASQRYSAMSRKLVWIEQQLFRGFGCSDCCWRFTPLGAPDGRSFDEMRHKFEMRRDNEFSLHVCANHPRTENTKSE
jgi:hypothetical protein